MAAIRPGTASCFSWFSLRQGNSRQVDLQENSRREAVIFLITLLFFLLQRWSTVVVDLSLKKKNENKTLSLLIEWRRNQRLVDIEGDFNKRDEISNVSWSLSYTKISVTEDYELDPPFFLLFRPGNCTILGISRWVLDSSIIFLDLFWPRDDCGKPS